MTSHHQQGIGKRLLIGAAAGCVGSLVMSVMQAAQAKLAPKTQPPIRRHPGAYVVDKDEALLDYRTRARIPRQAEQLAAQTLHFDYGSTFGTLYGAIGPRDHVVVDGVAIGITTWAAGYLGWLPATGLMKPIWKQKPTQVVIPLAMHLVFGVVVAATYRALQRAEARRTPRPATARIARRVRPRPTAIADPSVSRAVKEKAREPLAEPVSSHAHTWRTPRSTR